MNRHTVARDAVDTDIEKASDHCTQHENKNPHIFHGCQLLVKSRFCENLRKLDVRQETGELLQNPSSTDD